MSRKHAFKAQNVTKCQFCCIDTINILPHIGGEIPKLSQHNLTI